MADTVDIKFNADLGDTIKELRLAITELTKLTKAEKDAGAQAQDTGDKMAKAAKKGHGEVGILAEKFNELGATIAAAFATHQIVRFFEEALHAYEEQEKANVRLLASLDGNEAAFRRLQATASEYQNNLNIPDDVFQNLASFLSAQGRTEAQIIKTIRTAANLKDVLGVDLQTAVQQLDATNEGFTRGVGRLDGRIKKLTQEQLANGEAIDLLSEKYEGFAEKAAETGSGKLEQLGIQFDEVKESIGGFISQILESTGVVENLGEELKNLAGILGSEDVSFFDKIGVLFSPGSTTQMMSATNALSDYTKKLVEVLQTGTPIEQQYARRILQTQLLSDKTGQFADALDEVLKKQGEFNQSGVDFLKSAINVNKQSQESADKLKEKWQKLAEEIKKANEELYKKLQQLRIENEQDVFEKLIMQRNAEIAEIEKSKANEELKGQVIAEIRQKYQFKFDELRMKALKQEREDFNAHAEQMMQDFEQRNEEARKNTESQVDQFSKFDFALANALGIDDLEKVRKIEEGFKEVGKTIYGFVNDAIANYARLAQARVDYLDKQVAENLQRIQIEQKDREDGYANDVTALKKRDVELQKQRDRAVKEQQNAAKLQFALDTATQGSSLVTGIANILKTTSTIPPPFGQILAGLGIAAMLAAFTAGRVKAAQATKFREGGSFILDGNSHENGGVMLAPGYEAEGGERIAVFSRNATRNNKHLPELIDAINKGRLVVNKDRFNIDNKNNVVVNVAGQEELTEIRDILKDNNSNSRSGRMVRNGSTTIFYRN